MGYLCWKTTLGPSERRIHRGWTDIPHRLEKAIFKCIAKIQALECKANYINKYFRLFYNLLRMSESFSDVMSFLYLLLVRFLS